MKTYLHNIKTNGLSNFIRKTAVAAIMLAGIMFSATSCGEKIKSGKTDISGEWELVSFDGIATGNESISVYIAFSSNGTFELFQKLGEGRHVRYSGTYALTNNVLSGQYSSGDPFGTAYEVELQSSTLTLTADNKEKSIYKKSAIPEKVRSEAASVKSGINQKPLL